MTDASGAQGRPRTATQRLVAAVNAGDAALVTSLLREGADPNAAGYNGRTVLMRAASTGRAEVVRALLDAGADVNAKKENGATALVMAAFFGHAEIVRVLLEAGADPAVPTPQGVPLGEWAEAAGFDEVAALLRSAGAVRARGFAPEGERADGRAAEVRREDAASIFPSSGTFRPVVPLAEIEAGPASVGATPNEGHVEQDETTLVPPRVRTPPPPPAARPRRAFQSWPVIVLALALLAAAGVILDARWRDSRRAAENQQPAAAEESPAAEVSAAQPAAAEPEAVAAPPQPAEPAPQPNPRAGNESTVVSGAAADASDETARQGGSPDKAERAAAPEVRRAPEVETPSRRAAAADARVKVAAAPARRTNADAPAPTPVRRAPRPPAGRVSTAAAPANALPVSAPPPSAKSEKVIKWP
jgi:hypothetical protein